jgi:predicted alpha/beta superfamily hydrolase
MKHLLVGIVLCVSICSAQAQISTKPFTLGVIDSLASKVLGETRMLNIYLPEGFQANDTTKYPVVYLLDGSADEDFIHVVGLYQFNNFFWINRVPKSIVVGIANVDRRRDFTYPTSIIADKNRNKTSGHSEAFINFIQQELQPFIQARYKGKSNSNTIIGQSLGGLLATEILLKHPAIFQQYIIISPSIWWDNASLLQLSSPILEANFAQPTSVYIGVGKEGLAPTATPHVMEVEANLLVEKLKASKSSLLTVHFDYLPQEDHATITHQAVFNALRMLHPVKGK